MITALFGPAERRIWASLRSNLAATPAGAALFADAAQARAWPPGSAPAGLTPEAVGALNAIIEAGQAGLLATHPIDNAAIRLEEYSWPERIGMAAAMRGRLGRRPTIAVRRAG